MATHAQKQDGCYSTSKMNPLLYPTRNNNISESELYATDVTGNDNSLPLELELELLDKPNHDISWVEASPLEWIENIACMADASLNLDENEERFKALTIETEGSSDSSSYYIPPPPPGIQRNKKRSEDLCSTSITYLKECMSNEGRDDDDVRSNLSSVDNDGKTVNKKRSRDSWDTEITVDIDDDIKQNDIIRSCSWDTANIPESLLPYDALSKLQSLASRVKLLPVFDLLSSSYERIYDHFGQSSNSIVMNSSLDNEKRELLHNLYLNTVQKLEALLSMARNIELEKITTAGGVTYPVNTSKGGSKNKSSTNGYSKNYFTQYMNKWLIDNWTNPYPDDKVMNEISNACGVNVDIVSNWLINARTRKWRPAIVKAYELGRGADYLLEDSIHIFEGKPIREILSSPNLFI